MNILISRQYSVANFTKIIWIISEHDETFSKWKWHTVKQIGAKPVPRSGISCIGVPGTNKVLFFGGVQDLEDIEDDSDDDDDNPGNFFNDLLSVVIENERATWTKVELKGKKDPSKKSKKIVEEDTEPQGTVPTIWNFKIRF